jgi:hypothetical protein
LARRGGVGDAFQHPLGEIATITVFASIFKTTTNPSDALDATRMPTRAASSPLHVHRKKSRPRTVLYSLARVLEWGVGDARPHRIQQPLAVWQRKLLTTGAVVILDFRCIKIHYSDCSRNALEEKC